MPVKAKEKAGTSQSTQRPPVLRQVPPEPLSRGESERLRTNLRRLASELRAVLRDLVEANQGASALARELRIDRATAHRVLMLAGQRDPALHVLADSPGPEALEQFADAIAKRKNKGVDVASLRAALAQFRNALGDLGGGSKSHLLRRVAASSSTTSDLRQRREQELREQLFGIAAELIGRSTETRIDLMICRANPDDARQMDFAQVRGIIGHGRARRRSRYPLS
jgi:hypothetical protein